MNDRDDSIDSLRDSWNALDSNDEALDPRTLAVVASLRATWSALPIPVMAIPEFERPAIDRPATARRRVIPRVAALAACLALASIALFRAQEPAPALASPPPVANAEWRLVAELTLATLGSSSPAAFLPVVCLCCEALLLADTARAWPIAPRGEPDAIIAEAIAADCRGDWSRAVSILEPVLEQHALSAEQRVRASAALSHAYRQLGRTDDAARAEAALVAAR